MRIVATDGGENSSVTWADDLPIYEAARAADVRVVVMGALVANLDFMKRAATETGGLFFYARGFDEVAVQVQELADALAGMEVVKIIDPTYAASSAFEVDVAGKTISF